LAYGNPFPGWSEGLSASIIATAQVQVPGTPHAASAQVRVGVSFPASKASAGPIVPLVGPVQDPRVNGASAFGGLTGVTTTPTLSWKAPALGAPAGYRVRIVPYQIQNGSPVELSSYWSSLVTTDTSVTLPPCVLNGGEAYAAIITAISTGVDLGAHPNRQGAEYHRADLATDGMTP
jgi:hypothetical protein